MCFMTMLTAFAAQGSFLWGHVQKHDAATLNSEYCLLIAVSHCARLSSAADSGMQWDEQKCSGVHEVACKQQQQALTRLQWWCSHSLRNCWQGGGLGRGRG